MKTKKDQLFDVSSIGAIYRKTLTFFAHHLEDEDGNEIGPDDLEIGKPFFVIFPSGNGFTRTSAVRVT